MKKMLWLTYFICKLCFSEYLFIEGGNSNASQWTHFSKNKRLNIQNILKKLAKSETGKSLIKKASEKAKAQGLTLYDIIDVGSGSLTDTTLIRRFDRHHIEKITYETNSKVFINKELSMTDAILDLAHELTHYVYRAHFNPYVKNFSLAQFIKGTIEGEGGEVQAFLSECMVQKELFGGTNNSRYNCKKIIDQDSGKLSRQIATKRFYQVGNYFESFKSVLQKYKLTHYFPELSSKKESFVSSAYGIPYPVAAFEEYISVLNKACENDKRRLALLKDSQGRVPASVSDIEESYEKRCSDFIN